MKIPQYFIASLSILLLFISCTGDTTKTKSTMSYPEFYHACNQVKVLLDQDRLDVAMAFFDSVAIQVPKVPSHYYYTLAQKAAESDKCNQAAKYLKLAIENGKEYQAIRTNLQKIKACDEALKDIIAMEEEIHEKTFIYDYKTKLDSMYELDQVFRNTGDKTKVAEHDSLNKKLLLELYDKYGYPSEELVGSITTGYAKILMLRTDPDNGTKIFLPLFHEAYNKGYINARKYAGFTDRIISSGLNYVAPYYYEMPTHDYRLMIEIEKAEIDRRRDSIGLAPIPR